MATRKDGFKFDKDGNLDPQTAKTEWGEIHWSAPARLGWIYYEQGKYDDAFRSATMGLSLSQHHYRSKGYCDAAEIEAGDTECRVIRAYVYMCKGDLAAAKTEVQQARRSKEAAPGHSYEPMAIKVEQELQSRLKRADAKDAASSAN